MKTKYLKYAPPLLVALLASNSAIATPSYFYSGSGIASQWAETSPGSGVLSTTAGLTATIDSIMAGNASAPGGAVQLVTATGSTPSLTGSVETLTADFGGGNVLTLSSLNAADWGTAGSGGLLDIWAQAYSTAYAPSLSVNDIENLLPTLSAFELSQSNPFISYANLAYGEISIGLAGYYPTVPTFPTNTQFSKIVKATFHGVTEYLFSMGPATASGVHENTNTAALTGNYEVKIPEPSALALLFAGLTGFLGLRRKAVTA